MTNAQVAIAKLIDLAETGEIDPWDVQVIEVIDRFLTELSPTDADLPQSGQAFLWASMLVLLKANTLSSLTATEQPECEAENLENEEQIPQKNSNLPISLENHLRRRSSAPPLRKRRVTLQELIEQIKEIEAKLKERPSKPRPRPSRASKARLITQLAHQENLSEVASFLEQFLIFHESELKSNPITLEQLLELLASNDSKIPGHDRVGVFWALLLLSAESKVELHQTEFYQDLTLKPLVSDRLIS